MAKKTNSALSRDMSTLKKVGKTKMKETSVDVSGGKKKKLAEAVSENIYESKQFMTMLHQPESTVENQRLDDFTRQALFTYGSYVVEDRAVPDYRDGLKPSHRSILWSLAGLNLRPSAGYKKSARTVGDAIGKWHPHGDMAVYGAMVTVANTLPPAVDGQGNWGTPVDKEAAYRYTESKMSKFAHSFLLDSKYLKVVPKIPNFSNDDEIPLYLPALLPYMLFNGSVPAPAYGVRAGNPSFSFTSVSKVVCDMLRGEEYDSKRLAKTLKIHHPFGCDDVTDKKEFRDFMQTGKGGITYRALMEFDYDKKYINIRSFVPAGFSSTKSLNSALDKISAIPGVKSASASQGRKTKGSGPYGALCIIQCQKNLSETEFDSIAEKVENIVTNKVSYRLGVTIRKADSANLFRYMSYVNYFAGWVKYRIGLELKLLRYLIEEAKVDLHINEVYLFAVENMDKLLKALPKVLVSKDPDATLATILKIPVADATIILDRKVRQLAKMEAAALKDKIKVLKAEIATLTKDLKNPGDRAARDTEERVRAYIKSPDVSVSGLKVE